MAERPAHIRYINSVLAARLDRGTLLQIYRLCASRKSFCLVGFNDYAKHIINLLSGAVEHVIDDDPAVLGIAYRGHEVVGSDVEIKSLLAVVCKYEYASEYTAKIKLRYPEKSVACPAGFEGVSTRFSDPFRHDPYLRHVFAAENDAPASMMNRDKLMYLCELLRSCVGLEGDVAEFGVWQGGSAFFMMRACNYLGTSKRFLLFDMFESLAPSFKEAIMCDDEVRRKLAFYKHFELISGDMNERISEYSDSSFCFVHYDLGFHPQTLSFLLRCTKEGGVIVFDNYGFSTASPALYQAFFAERGETVISVPFSEQGVLIKRGA